ncbi:MAG: FKBP-type peptidyl-prolyl cis-trans isomerase [Chthoniobacterales bacterium]
MKTLSVGSALFLVATLVLAEPIPAPSDVAEAPADASTTASGLASKVMAPGKGKAHPTRTDVVKVQYTGWTTDGKMFDSSRARGKPATFPLDKVLPGWTEGVQLMVAGETRRFWIPEDLANKGAAGKPKGTLVFDVQLISFDHSPTVPPPDVKSPPGDAEKTGSGLSYLVLRPGTGKHPSRSDKVTVQYSGWTTDGKLFDSSVTRGQPATFRVDGVIEGWTEGLQLMAEGEKARFWIPEKLAYKGESAPYGMLVFEIELLKVE